MIYDLLAPIYDKVNGDLDYGIWAESVMDTVKREFRGKAELGLDLGCGTGSMTIPLAKLGLDMIGVDASPEMLTVAREKAEAAKTKKPILWLLQDMTKFELYGTVDVAVSTLDCLNHLTRESDFKKTLSLVHNYLSPGGLFFFDLNTPYKFKNVYGNEVYTVETDDCFCIWENRYHEKTGICDFSITLFHEREDGSYLRFDDVQKEKCYPREKVEKWLCEAGFDVIGVYADAKGEPLTDTSGRMFFVARCRKDNP